MALARPVVPVVMTDPEVGISPPGTPPLSAKPLVSSSRKSFHHIDDARSRKEQK